jgi:hypothetical protein
MDLADDRLGHLFTEVRAVQEDASKRSQHRGPVGERGQLAQVDAGGEDRPLTAQWTDSCAAAARRASPRARSNSWLIALRFSGRFNTT